MDEPTASLDFGNQQIVLSHMRNLVKEGLSVLMVTHDPHHAFFCANRVVVMKEGCIIENGDPHQVMTEKCLEDIYHTPLEVMRVSCQSGNKTTVCVPL